jgi:nitroreductase/ferredoxin-like protein FixX
MVTSGKDSPIFRVDLERCIGCGQCAAVCPAMIIAMEQNIPAVSPELEQFCIECLHCSAICSEDAVEIVGYGRGKGIAEPWKRMAQPEAVETLIKARRTVRNYSDKNIDPALIEKLITVAAHAPSGHNDRQLLFTVVDDKGVMFDLREEVMAGLETMIAARQLPQGMEMFSDIVTAWKESGRDIIFRHAPHLLIVSASEESAAPKEDAMIALATFELYARSHGIGTIWNGLATLTICELLPSLQPRLGIPEEHEIGYVMGFGLPSVRFERTIERKKPQINTVR